MIDWHNKSDRTSIFFDGQVREDDAANMEAILTVVFNFLLSTIIGKGNAVEFDRLFLEVNCDTGRVLVAATTQERRGNKNDGCSVRIQEIQDYWYDLIESGTSYTEFTRAIASKVAELGQIFRRILLVHLEELRGKCSKHGFKYTVFGSEPGVAYLDELFTI